MAKISFGTANSRKLSKHHLPINAIGTFSVNGRQVTGCLPVTRGDKFKVNYGQFSRLAPLVAPTFGSFNIKTMAFFVPAHTIWRGYRSWVSGSSDTSVANAPLNFSLEDLAYLITNNAAPSGNTDWTGLFVEDPSGQVSGSYTTISDLDAIAKDFIVFDHTTQAYHAANFTALGRSLWNTLICLGYNFPTLLDAAFASYYTGLNYSIYPFLAYARVCYDWLYPSAYVNQQGFSFLFETSLNASWAIQTTRQQLIQKMVDTWFNQYDQDFYTSLWLKPNCRAVGGRALIPSTNVDDVYGGDSALKMAESISKNYLEQSSASIKTVLSSNSLRWLTSMSDFVLRNNIGGSRFREFMKAHFGYNTEMDICDESLFLKMWSDVVNIDAVVNTTSAQNSGALGELAGKGQSNGSGTLKFDAKEAGFLIFVTECKPNVGYFQGDKPWARALTDRFQLYTPEFDGVGMEAVPKSGLFSSYAKSNDMSVVQSALLNDAFGFAPRYSERYKVGYDSLFGDFRFRSRNTGMDSWHTMRDLTYGRGGSLPLALDAQFLAVDNQYQRIFRYIGAQSDGVTYDVDDKIWSFLQFDVTKFSTAKSLGNSLPFFDESGQNADMNYGGSDVK